ncbi:MAG: hypothetical protein JSS07_05880 [Proteobacteria bacterium]|nr:hypothetical protein [Pseudomonadota bacterium]
MKNESENMLSAKVKLQKKKHNLAIKYDLNKIAALALLDFYTQYGSETQLLQLNKYIEMANLLPSCKDSTQINELGIKFDQETQVILTLKDSCFKSISNKSLNAKLKKGDNLLEVEKKADDNVLTIFNEAVLQSNSEHIVRFFKEKILNTEQLIALSGDLASRYYAIPKLQKKYNYRSLRKLVEQLTRFIFDKYEYPCASFEIDELFGSYESDGRFTWGNIESQLPFIKGYFSKVPSEVINFLLPIYRVHISHKKPNYSWIGWKTRFGEKLIIKKLQNVLMGRNKKISSPTSSDKLAVRKLLYTEAIMQGLINQLDNAIQSYEPKIQIGSIQAQVYAATCKLAVTQYKREIFFDQCENSTCVFEIINNIGSCDTANKEIVNKLLSIKATLQQIISQNDNDENGSESNNKALKENSLAFSFEKLKISNEPINQNSSMSKPQEHNEKVSTNDDSKSRASSQKQNEKEVEIIVSNQSSRYT